MWVCGWYFFPSSLLLHITYTIRIHMQNNNNNKNGVPQALCRFHQTDRSLLRISIVFKAIRAVHPKRDRKRGPTTAHNALVKREQHREAHIWTRKRIKFPRALYREVLLSWWASIQLFASICNSSVVVYLYVYLFLAVFVVRVCLCVKRKRFVDVWHFIWLLDDLFFFGLMAMVVINCRIFRFSPVCDC